jgi:hypothetical protein
MKPFKAIVRRPSSFERHALYPDALPRIRFGREVGAAWPRFAWRATRSLH